MFAINYWADSYWSNSWWASNYEVQVFDALGSAAVGYVDVTVDPPTIVTVRGL